MPLALVAGAALAPAQGCRGSPDATEQNIKREKKKGVRFRADACSRNGNGRFAYRQGNDLIRPRCARPPSPVGKAPRPAAVRPQWKRQVEPTPRNRASKSSPKQTASAGITSHGCCIFLYCPGTPARPRPPPMAGGAAVTSVGLRRRSPPLSTEAERATLTRSGATVGEPRPSAPTPAPFPSGEGVTANAVTDGESLACSASRRTRCAP